MKNVKNVKNFEELLLFVNELTFLDVGSTHRKHTHADQYLNFDVNHHMGYKRSIIRSVFHCANSYN